MTIRKIIKKIMPSFLTRLFYSFRLTQVRSPFEGVYLNWDEVPTVGSDHQDDQWAYTVSDTTQSLINLNESNFVPAGVTGEVALLPLIAALAPAPLRIIDWGGATGFGFLSVIYGAIDRIEKYVVVEYPRVCKEGALLFKDTRISFVDEIPQEAFDLVLLGSSLQYAKDYKKILKQLAGPRYILLTKTPAGDNVTFVTCQVNLPGKKHPYWIFNINELVSILAELGYKLIFKSAISWDIDQSEFEPQYRVGRCCNLLFEKVI
jgi:putative methyltransferase (TIGR04325 family)